MYKKESEGKRAKKVDWSSYMDDGTKGTPVPKLKTSESSFRLPR